ncbi:GNAT family N-acetyltransferase [Streptococcus xiaochunlingii]|uniref:GNAT family N-acetyltransferase n=1 Tax=Streptococcus xiaochunlingii TaxID=2589788 RepID=A0ABY2YCH3_9STRE|nr:GNAT family N-acetyltransferase [Streptococcus xiaochunlingii]TPE36802.1 GNAT family N-acetyltransferase [Streptococcus xiaochunlingii]
MLVIKEVKDEKQKMAVVAEVLKDLPEWFGMPESTQAYIEGAKDLRVWVAYQESDVVGFISLSYSSEDCAEIDCLGVKKTFQGQGIGRELITTIEREAVKQVDYLQVKTVAEGSNKDYDRTNVFYRSLDFKKLEIFPQLWDLKNPCQILIKKIN